MDKTPGREKIFLPSLVLSAVLFAAPALLAPVHVFSQSPQGLITSLSITGLKRTRVSAAEKPLKRFIGEEAAALDMNEVKAAVLDTGILEPLSVEIIEDMPGGRNILAVEVREKWSIFPIPVFFIGSGSMAAGGAFYDANAFGVNDKMAAAGMYQSNGWMATLMYIHSPGGDRAAGWNASFFFAREDREDGNQRDKTIRRFSIDSFAAGGGLRYQFTSFAEGSFRLGYTNRMLRENGHSLLAPSSGAQVLEMGPEFSIRKTVWDGYLLSEKSASLRYLYSQGIGAPSFHSLSFRGIFEQTILPGFRTSIRSGLLWNPLVPVLFESSPGAAEVNILPRSFSARHYAGLSLGLEKYLFKISAGTFSALASWQMVYSHGSIMENQFDYGVSGAVFFYMSKLAIPAVGIGVAYNIPAGYAQFSFSMGMSL
jgi:hypothetical protein